MRNYMHIMNFRFNYVYKFEVQVDDHLLRYECPHFILQPLVENAIQHGLMELDREGAIRVSITQENSLLTIIVEDNGIGTNEDSVFVSY